MSVSLSVCLSVCLCRSACLHASLTLSLLCRLYTDLYSYTANRNLVIFLKESRSLCVRHQHTEECQYAYAELGKHIVDYYQPKTQQDEDDRGHPQFHVCEKNVCLAESAKNLGVYFDSSVMMAK